MVLWNVRFHSRALNLWIVLGILLTTKSILVLVCLGHFNAFDGVEVFWRQVKSDLQHGEQLCEPFWCYSCLPD